MKLLKAIIHKSKPKDYKPKKIKSTFDYKYIKYKGDKQATIMEYLEKIRQYLHDMINDLKSSGEWKIQSKKQ